MQRLVLLMVAFSSIPAYASFGASPCGADFSCHFVTWGLVIGVAAGIPASGVAFAALSVVFGNSGRSKASQAVLGAVFGVVAYEIAAVCGALSGSMGKDPMMGLAAGLGILATLFVFYVRSRAE